VNPETEAVITWLQSPEGEAWSHERMKANGMGGMPIRHSSGWFASIKPDHESCVYSVRLGMFLDCGPGNNFSHTDKLIIDEMLKYGMNGVPGDQPVPV
jgi:hypothetical protein